jgi:hypothetical protein
MYSEREYYHIAPFIILFLAFKAAYRGTLSSDTGAVKFDNCVFAGTVPFRRKFPTMFGSTKIRFTLE